MCHHLASDIFKKAKIHISLRWAQNYNMRKTGPFSVVWFTFAFRIIAFALIKA